MSLQFANATRNDQGGYIESLLAQIARLEKEVEWYRTACGQMEQENARLQALLNTQRETAHRTT